MSPAPTTGSARNPRNRAASENLRKSGHRGEHPPSPPGPRRRPPGRRRTATRTRPAPLVRRRDRLRPPSHHREGPPDRPATDHPPATPGGSRPTRPRHRRRRTPTNSPNGIHPALHRPHDRQSERNATGPTRLLMGNPPSAERRRPPQLAHPVRPRPQHDPPHHFDVVQRATTTTKHPKSKPGRPQHSDPNPPAHARPSRRPRPPNGPKHRRQRHHLTPRPNPLRLTTPSPAEPPR